MSATTLAERLGFAATDRIAIIHADDVGMCHAANAGAFQAMRDGVATCGSVMVPCPWFQETADLARGDDSLDLGVHLTLNAEWPHYRWGPVAGRSVVPSLLDDQGYLPRTLAEVAARAKPEHVEIELRAQIERALEAGIDVTHIDSHMGTVFIPPFVDVYRKLAIEFEVPALAAEPQPAVLEAAGLGGALEMLKNVMQKLEADGFPILQCLDPDSLSFAPGQGRAHNERRLAMLPEGVSYLICHPAQDGEELSHITPDSAHHRDFERAFWSGAEGAEALESAGVKTVGMRPLRDLLRG